MKSLRPIFSFTLFILLVGLACSTITGEQATSTPLPSPTQTVQVIPTETPPEPTQVLTTEAVPTTNVPAPTGASVPSASHFYMATDKEGTNKTTVFSPTDDFYVFFDVSGIDVGTKFQSRWYALDVEGEDPNVPFETIDYTYEEGIRNI